MFLYGDSGSGKSSLINAGLLPHAHRLGFEPVRLRVQPRGGEELVIEPVVRSDDSADVLPCILAPETDGSSRVVLSIADFEARVRAISQEYRPLLVFDQFEEILTLFDDADAIASRSALAEMIVRLLREPLPVKLLFAFREDYLGRVKQLLAACPELVDHALRLGPPSADTLETIIRGPFERFPGRFRRELDPALAQRLRAALAERFGIGEVSLSEVQTVCLRLWQSADPAALLADEGVQGVLEDDLGEALDALAPDLRAAAIALLGQMVTSAGTRNVISAEDLRQHVQGEDHDIPSALLDEALDCLERDSKLVRRERRHDLYLYEITSEFLVPWISRRREELRRDQDRQRERRRLRILGSIAGALLVVVAIIAAPAVVALHQRSEARRQAADATSLALASSATPLLNSRPDVSLLLALEARRASPLAEARGSVIAALTAARNPALRAIMHGHTNIVFSVALSPDGRTLASASADQTIRLWDVRTHKQRGSPLYGHTDELNSVAFSPDGRALASGSDDGTVRLWDVQTHKQLGTPLRGHTNFVRSVAFRPDGRALASGSDDGTVRLWDVQTHKQLGTPLRGHTNFVRSVAFRPDGRMLASAGDDRTVRLWDVRSHKQLGPPLTGHTGHILSVAFRPDGRALASGSDDGTVRLWDVRTHQQLRPPLTGHTGRVFSVAFSRDGPGLASGGDDGTVRLWDARSHMQRGVALRGHTAPVFGVAFSPDGRSLASTAADQTVRLWNVRTHNQLGRSLRGHTEAALNVAFSPDGRTLASAGFDRTVRLWDVRTHKALGRPLTGHTGHVFSVAFSPDGGTLASASFDQTVRLWEVRSHKQLGTPLFRHTGYVDSVAFSPDGGTLASASADRTVRLWDVETHKQLGSPLRGHAGVVISVAFSPDGRTLASASFDHTIRLWDRILWRTFAELQREVCNLVGNGLNRAEWAQYAGGIPYRRSCP